MKNVLLTVLMTTAVITGLQAQTTNTTASPTAQPATVKPKTVVHHTHTPGATPAATMAANAANPNVKTPKPVKMEHGHKSGVINAAGVPEKIKTTFANDVEKPTNVRWAKHDSLYEVWFTDWGMEKFRAYFSDTSSDVSEMAVKQFSKTVPDNVKQYVTTNYTDKAQMIFYKGYAFRTDANIAKDLDKPFLRIDYADHTLYFDGDGKFVREAYTQPAQPKPAL